MPLDGNIFKSGGICDRLELIHPKALSYGQQSVFSHESTNAKTETEQAKKKPRHGAAFEVDDYDAAARDARHFTKHCRDLFITKVMRKQ
jgi:hypothetical protein